MTKRLAKLILGLFLFSLGIITTIQADIGYAPWDVFHVGLAKTLDTSIGIASIYAALVIVVIVYLLGEKLGIGTVLNMVLIGVFIDVILYIDFLPKPSNLFVSLLMMIIGLFIISIASYFYIGSGFGAGPRDNLMVALRRKTKLPVGISRIIVELSATVVGWMLGGKVGIGTIISVVCIGFCIQITFKTLNFNTLDVEHETIKETLQNLNKAS